MGPTDPTAVSPSDPAAELVEWVDADGSVIDVVTRERVRAETLRHRCTYVAVLTTDDDLIVHQRADWKDVYPSYWDLAFGGITGVGEPWDEAARRELAEEAGVEGTELVPLGPVRYDADDGHIVGRVYLTRHDGPLSCPDGEVVATGRVPLAGIDRWLEGRRVCLDSLQLVLPLVRAAVEGAGNGADEAPGS
ncbi:MAG: NUDIX domain-containing protein [Actinomycetota bacterium]